ncbi:MAG TPA: CHAD domain-containing protein [Lacipirellulaceae bacterium]|jgi:CHAD domain-containing protein|nr:CHAD domain-containing protein [Lacipirellulaceae bacterium]
MTLSAKWIEGIGPDSSVEDAARRALEPRLAQVMHLLPMAAHLAEHDIEHVHRLRVATRRAGAALKLFGACLGQKPRRWMKKRLRKIRRAVGDARDLDVLADRLTREYGEVVAPIVDLVMKDRAAAQPAILDVARQSSHHDDFATHTAKLLAEIKPPIAKHSPDRTLTYAGWSRDQFVSVADEFLAAFPVAESTAADLHQFRIRAKALRYVIELVAPVFPANTRRRLYPIVEKLQERLGTSQDHVAAISRCQAWAAASHDSLVLETLRELSEAEQKGFADSVGLFHAWWNDDRAALVHTLLAEATQLTDRPADIPQTSPID